MNRPWRKCVVGLCLPLAWAVNAPAETLTWEDCVRLAAGHHPALVAAAEQVRAAEYAVGGARAARRPQLSLGASAEHAEQDGESAADASLSAAASAEQALYTGGRLAASVESAQAALDRARADYDSAAANLTYDLRGAFADLLYAQEQAALLGKIAERRRENLELVRLRYEGGREHKGSLAMTEASSYQAEIEQRQAERQVESARRVLARTIGLPDDDRALTISGVLAAGPAPDTVDWEELAKLTPAYFQGEASIRSAAAAVQSARSGYRPDISLSGSAGRSGDTDAFDTDRWTVGVRLSFPLWSGGQTRAAVARARAQQSAAAAQQVDTLNGLISDFSERLQAFRNATENVTVQTRFAEASDLRAGIARELYGAGLLTFENWDVIENERISYQRRLLDVQYTAVVAEAAWQKAVGRGVFPPEE